MGVIVRTSGLIVALAVTIVTVAVTGESAAERDPMVRGGRGASHRLDGTDDVAHAHEVTEPDATTAGLALGEVARMWPDAPQHEACPVADVPSSAVLGALDVRAASLRPVWDGPLSAAGVPSTPGRAPPTA